MNEKTYTHRVNRAPKRDICGIVLLDKPTGISSSAALTRVRGIFHAQKGGHTGALDPLASGLLPICLGESAKFSSFFLEGRKKYIATGRLGAVTATADAEGEVLERRDIGDAASRLDEVIPHFRGLITQVPPIYSAIKVGGKPLYRYARKGQADKVEIPSRQVEIYELNLLEHDEENFTIEVYCSKGTYIRTLVSDIGAALGCGAYVTMLRRTAVQGLPEGRMITLDALQELCDGREDLNDFAPLDALLYPVDKAVAWLPWCDLPPDMAGPLTHGVRQGPDLSRVTFSSPEDPDGRPLRLMCGELFLGMGAVKNGIIIPQRMMSGRL